MTPLSILAPTGDFEYPTEPIPFYVATKKGWLVNSPTLFGTARTLTKEAPSPLLDIDEAFQLNGRLMPAHILTQFHDFARQNLTKNKAECSAYITHNPTTDDYRLFIPEQYVSHTSVDHRIAAGGFRKGYRAVGTIHSHCDFGAFHSSTDTHDMGKMPGLHITCGFVNRDDPDFVFALSVGESSFTVKREQIIDEQRTHDNAGYATAPEWWLGFVHTGNAPWDKSTGITTTYKPHTTTKKYDHTWSPSKKPHWSSWTDEDWDDYGRNVGDNISPTTKQAPYQQQQMNIDAFTQFAEEVEVSEYMLEVEAFRLALNGFVLSYNIIYNPNRASAYIDTKDIEGQLNER